ncbi:MAG: tryptophan 2,3-dioxygenase family protein [Candidatus Xenobia bacterium]
MTDYEKYIRTESLLALQKKPEELAIHDELLFQITHQSCELWMKQLLHELQHVMHLLDEDQLAECARILGRVIEITKVLTSQFPILETLLPLDFHVIRTQLGRGSGSESPGFNALLRIPQQIWPHVATMLERHQLTALQVQREPRRHADVMGVLNGLMEWDEQFQKLRYIHWALTRRVLGTNVLSLKKIPVGTLSPGGSEPLFPELWKAVDELTMEHKPPDVPPQSFAPSGHGTPY